jgi:hypothetical protein
VIPHFLVSKAEGDYTGFSWDIWLFNYIRKADRAPAYLPSSTRGITTAIVEAIGREDLKAPVL